MKTAAFSDYSTARHLLQQIRDMKIEGGPITLMEVCGTHTMAIGRYGIRRLLPEYVQLISGPGCPVCVTPGEYIDNAAEIALRRNVRIATFGDMVRVPGLSTSLAEARSEGADISVITSPMDICSMEGEILFLSVGFETTAAPIAAFVSELVESGRENVSLYTSLKTIPHALEALIRDPETDIDGFILPGHVSAVIGADSYAGIDIPSWITGFEINDILEAIRRIQVMISSGRREVGNGYTRIVTDEGNRKAQKMIDAFFTECSQPWRGIGTIPQAGLKLREEYAYLDAEQRYGLAPLSDEGMPEGCACGSVLKGKIRPSACPLFGDRCIPEQPVGPCMVSSEGSCAAYYAYERNEL